MTRIGKRGLCIAAMLAWVAVGSATAAAAEYELTGLPELGRCVSVPAGSGEYAGSHCIVHTGKGNHDWLPGPGANRSFTAFGEGVALETVGKKAVACGGAEETGEYTGTKTENLTVNLIGCENQTSKQTCQSNPTKTGEIETTGQVEGELGFIKGGSKPQVGLDIRPKAPAKALFTFQCGTLPEAVESETVEGSVIGGPVMKPETPVEEFKIAYKVTSGKQTIQKFETGAKDTLTTTLVSGLSSTTEESGLRGVFEIINGELLEIKAKEVIR